MQISDQRLKLAAKGDLPAVQALLATEPALLNARSGGHRRTLLWEAARMGRMAVVTFLIEAGADPNLAGRYRHETIVLVKPYCIALLKKRTEIAGYLLDHGTLINGYTATFLGQLATLKQHLSSDPSLIHQPHPDDEVHASTLLHYALAGGQYETAKYLIEREADVVTAAPLLFDIVCRRGRMDLVTLLVNNGAVPSQANAFSVLRSNDGAMMDFFFSHGCLIEGVLTYACRGDKGEHSVWIEMLIKYGADVEETDDKGRTALHNAARAGFTQVIEVLIAAGAEVNARMPNGETPLALAIKKKHQAAVVLLKQYGGRV